MNDNFLYIVNQLTIESKMEYKAQIQTLFLQHENRLKLCSMFKFSDDYQVYNERMQKLFNDDEFYGTEATEDDCEVMWFEEYW